MMEVRWSGELASGLPSSVSSDSISHRERQDMSSKLGESQERDRRKRFGLEGGSEGEVRRVNKKREKGRCRG